MNTLKYALFLSGLALFVALVAAWVYFLRLMGVR